MKKYSKKALALIGITALLLTLFSTALPILPSAEEITYSSSFEISAPYSLTDVNGNSSAVKLGIADNLNSAVSGTDYRRIWWDSFIGDPRGWSADGIPADTSIPLVGYNIQTADGTSGSSGMATYYSSKALKNVRFDTSYSIADDYWIAEPLEFFVSKDGIDFEKIETVRETVGPEFTRNVCSGTYSQIYDTCSFNESDDIHFVRIISTIKDSTNDFSKQINRIYGIDYNCYEKEVTYSGSIDVSNPYSVTDLSGSNADIKLGIADNIPDVNPGVHNLRRIWWGTFVGDPSGWSDGDKKPDTSIPLVGYTLQTADGTDGSSGEIIYRFPTGVKDIRFDTAYSVTNNDGYAKPLEFYASCDGINFFKFNPERKTVGVKFERVGLTDMYPQIYDEYTFPEIADILFVKIVSELKEDHYFAKGVNRIYAIDYNIYEKEITYKKSLDVSTPYSVTAANGNTAAVKLAIAADLNSAAPGKADGIRVFYDNGDFIGNPNWITDSPIKVAGYNIQIADGTAGASGEAVYYSPSVIKDIRFDTSYSVNSDYWCAKPLEFYASADGINFRRIVTERDAVGIEFTRDVCSGMYSQIYDTYTFTETDNIHYVKIVSAIKAENNDFTKQINRIYAIDFNDYTKAGDVNGDEKIDILDLIHMKKHIAYGNELKNSDAADINGDGKCNALDLSALRRMILGVRQ